MSELWQKSAKELTEILKTKAASAVEITESHLGRLDAVNPVINAVVAEMPEEALGTARAIDARIASGEPVGALAGVPVTIKINADQAGHANTNGLKLLKDNVTDQDNPVVANIKKADAIIIGRTNTPAFSMRWFTRNTVHGHTRNPRNLNLTPGGSSGGGSAAVAAGIGAIAQGSDIAGSIRYPAYACGLHGIRPSLGRIPNINLTAKDRYIGAQITAVAGPMARTIDDLRLGLEAMSMKDVRDPWWTPVPHDSGAFDKKVALCIAPDGLDVVPEVEQALKNAAMRFKDAGWIVDEIPCPPMQEAAELQLLLWMAEMRRNSIELIEQEADPDALFVFAEMHKHFSIPDLNQYIDIFQSRARLTREWREFLNEYPIVLLPNSSELPFEDNLDVASSQSFARVIDAQMTQIGLPFMGVPCMSVSTGSVGNTPMGVQLVAARFREDVLLQAGEVIAEPVSIATPAS